MNNEFNEFGRDIKRKANLIRILARERLEVKRTADKKGKDYTFSDNLPNNEEEYEAEKNNKPDRIRELENKLSFFSDEVQDIADEVSKGYLKKISYKDLREMQNYLVTSEEDLYNLAQEYAELTGNETFNHPNYDKFLGYSSSVKQALNYEIGLREEMMGDFEGKAFEE